MAEGSQEQVREAKKGGSKKKIIIASTAAVVVLAGVAVGVLLNRNNSVNIEDDGVPMRDILVHEGNIQEIIDRDLVPTGYYQATMNTTWNFRDGTSVSDNAYVANDRANTNDVYFDVQLADTEEVIYELPVIPRGEYLDGIKLMKDLDAGTYDCVLIYHLIDAEQNTLSTLRISVDIVVEN